MNKLRGEIEVNLMEEIIKKLPQLAAIYSPEHTILIHGMGSQSRAFYNELRQNKSVEVLWSDWCGKRWWTYIFSFIPGQAGLTKVIDRTQLDTLYEEIGSLSMCGLYFIPNNKVNSVLEEVKSKKLERTIEDLFIDENNYFLLINKRNTLK